MILALTLVAMLLVTISKYQTNQASNNQFQTSLHFIEVVSKDLGVDKSEVYVNTSAATDGALVKVGPKFLPRYEREPTRQVSFREIRIESNRRLLNWWR